MQIQQILYYFPPAFEPSFPYHQHLYSPNPHMPHYSSLLDSAAPSFSFPMSRSPAPPNNARAAGTPPTSSISSLRCKIATRKPLIVSHTAKHSPTASRMSSGKAEVEDPVADVKEQPIRDPKSQLVISYRALRRARHTIEDFVLSYFPYHGLDPLKDFLRWWDTLVFVEGAIYQVDEENEQLAREGSISQTVPVPSGAALALTEVLLQKGLLTDEVEAELDRGSQYWEGERRLCACMLQLPTVPPEGHDPGFTLQDVHDTSIGKSFDYRVLNLLLYALRRSVSDPLLLEFLRVDEHLVDIGDDLVDYEDDVVRNSFNIYRAYVHLFGQAAPLKLVERISQYESHHTKLLQQLPEPLQQQFSQRKQDAAASEAALRWSFPPPILDEKHFREVHGGDSSSSEDSESDG